MKDLDLPSFSADEIIPFRLTEAVRWLGPMPATTISEYKALSR